MWRQVFKRAHFQLRYPITVVKDGSAELFRKPGHLVVFGCLIRIWAPIRILAPKVGVGCPENLVLRPRLCPISVGVRCVKNL